MFVDICGYVIILVFILETCWITLVKLVKWYGKALKLRSSGLNNRDLSLAPCQ